MERISVKNDVRIQIPQRNEILTYCIFIGHDSKFPYANMRYNSDGAPWYQLRRRMSYSRIRNILINSSYEAILIQI